MSLLKRYKIEIVHNEVAYEVNPLQSDVLIQWVKETGQFFFRRRIKNDITLHGSDFDILYAIEQSIERCLPVTVNITRRIDDELMFTGQAHLNNAKIDLDRCTFTLKIESHDKYSELLAIWSKETNLLEGTTKVAVSTNLKDISGSPSDIETDEDIQTLSIGFPGTQQFPNTNWPNPAEGWVITYDRIEVVDDIGGLSAIRTTRFAREFSTTNVGGTIVGGWVACTGGFFRNFPSVLKSENYELVSFGTVPGQWYYPQYTREYSWIPADFPTLGNGITLGTAFTKLLAGTGITPKSVFFDINASGLPAAPNNAPYNDGYYKKVIVFQRTDIKTPLASQPAVKMATNFKDFWKQVETQYNAIIWLEGDELRIEHISWVELFPEGIDWTIEAPEYLKGTNIYDYSKQETPSGEAFFHDGEQAALSKNYFDETFARFEFTYVYESGLDVPTNCAAAFNESIETISDKACNDVASIIAQPDSFNDQGFTFVATFAEGSATVMSGGNNILQSPNRMRGLQYWNRYFPHAIFRPTTGGIQFFYFTPRQIKRQNEFAVPLDDITMFNELLPTRSGIGLGNVDEAEYSFLKCELKITLKHD